MTKELKVILRKSGIGRPKTHKEILRGLGLTRLNKCVIRKDTPEIRGMIQKVIHLVEVVGDK